MSAAPAIWYSRILSDVDGLVGLDCVMAQNELPDQVRFQDHYEVWEVDPGGNTPVCLRFRTGTGKIRATLQDAFRIANGYLVVSPKLRDVLVRFELGTTRLSEVAIFKSNGRTPAEYPPHYLLHVTETRPTLIPEASRHITRSIAPGKTEPSPKARWHRTGTPDELAVRAAAAEGSDLWADSMLERRLFFSDRLKRAIQEAKVRSRALTFIAATVLP